MSGTAAEQSEGCSAYIRATIGLMDGQELDGLLASFSPKSHNVDFRAGNDAAPGQRRFIPGEQIAYIGFHRQAPPPTRGEPTLKRRELKVHVPGGRSLLVSVEHTALSGPLGFFCAPLDPEDRFERLYVYAHGVLAKEETSRLGDMLVKAGAVDASRLQHGLNSLEHEKHVLLGTILMEQAKVDPEAIEQAAKLQERKRLRIGELLLGGGWITEEQLNEALIEQKRRKGKRLGEVLVDLGLVREDVLSSTLAKKFLLPLVDLDRYAIDPDAMDCLPRDFIIKNRVLPVQLSPKVVTLALSDPLAIDIIEAVRVVTRRRVEELMVVRSQLERHITEALARLDALAMEEGMDQLLGEIEEQERRDADQGKREEAAEVSESDSTVIRLVNRIIVDAFLRGASDIHVEPQGREDKVRVRLRVDGECETYQEFPGTLRNPIVARLKIMAKLDISERRKPQDGKIRFQTKNGAIELRVATLPTVGDNEDVVMRILASSKPLPLAAMRLSARNLQQVEKLVSRPYGLFLVVGPTGSGKTTTLHSILGSINEVERKIWTAEDPVEITQVGLRQMQMNPKIGLTFAVALRAFLRADPDVIMVGEMRDHETASAGVEASLTGHLVFSTLHTNTAPETITRLIDIGLDPFSFADALLGVLAQRLARTLCPQCKKPHEVTAKEQMELKEAYGPAAFEAAFTSPAPLQLWTAPGCDACKQMGYKGRIGIHELLVAGDELRAAVSRKAAIGELRGLAVAGGMTTLLQDGISKALQGITDLKQVLAVCSR